ncbi:hypothetical protein M0638_18395 [Roseomonas sp. NAR14]|uniref:Uncharacterized protein n=1 Tax=Roseomonas acroporae TaxID=2937791 RepID=A0A9X1YA32_9PROT|nr:hypothetical protein [Roseomonas acroporae]MCK8786351.1 hypothetical protein [Roseomonas acroporae]
MPDDLTIRAAPPLPPEPHGAAASRPAAGDAAAAAPLRPNPSLRIDGALGLVVIEFRDWAGRITGSIPTSQELAAYRHSALPGLTPDDAPPDGRTAP